MNVVSSIKEKAKAKHRRVVLPEGTEPRAIKAAAKLLAEGIAEVILLGDQKEIEQLAKEHGLALNKVEALNPATAPEYREFVAEFMEIRKAKGIAEIRPHKVSKKKAKKDNAAMRITFQSVRMDLPKVIQALRMMATTMAPSPLKRA